VPAAVAVGRCGSVRAGDGCNAHVALSACAEFLERFGGHAAAGGFTVREGCMEAFREAFERECARQLGESGRSGVARWTAEPEMWLEPEDLTKELHDAIRLLEPFGEGNPEPVFGLRQVALSDVRLMGENGRHASLAFAGRNIPRAVWWNHGADAEALRAKSSGRFDIAFKLELSDWGGDEEHVELRIQGISASSC
jgi:single-stranded-DNA-specific exonuclease